MQLDAMGLDNVQTKKFQPVKPTALLMSEAATFYVRLKRDRKDKVFVRSAARNSVIGCMRMVNYQNATRAQFSVLNNG